MLVPNNLANVELQLNRPCKYTNIRILSKGLPLYYLVFQYFASFGTKAKLSRNIEGSFEQHTVYFCSEAKPKNLFFEG